MVVAIHTALFHDVSPTLNFIFISIICRQAVPFFAVCTGYFLSRQYFAKPVSDPNVFWKHWKKIFILYAVWSLIYMVYSIPRWIEIGWFSAWAFVDYAIAACTKGAYYHLWYLWGMLCAIPLFYGILRYFHRKYWCIFAGALWLLEVSLTAYSFWLPDSLTPIVQILQNAERIICLLPLLLAGACIHNATVLTRKKCTIGFILCFILLCTESFSLRYAGVQAISYAVFTLPTAYFLFRALLCISFISDKPILRRISAINLFVYCVHPMLVEVLAKFQLCSVTHFLLAAAGSSALGYLYVLITRKQT